MGNGSSLLGCHTGTGSSQYSPAVIAEAGCRLTVASRPPSQRHFTAWTCTWQVLAALAPAHTMSNEYMLRHSVK